MTEQRGLDLDRVDVLVTGLDHVLHPAAFCAASAAGGLPIARGKISYVQIGMLGPFEVRMDDGILAEVPGARLRGLLIALALEPGHVVPNATLVDWIWGERPPSDAANALQRLVSRLRKALPEGLVEGHTGATG
jgi:Transcriptional regulatory protein, C terminal